MIWHTHAMVSWVCTGILLVISLLRLWTRNQPFFDFPHDMIQTSGTACTLFQHPKKPWHVPRPDMCSVTLPKDSLRNSDQPWCHALPYIVSCSSTLEWCVPCVPSCLKFYLSYKLFPLLNSCFTILFSYFGLLLCFLSATNWPRSHFSLCYFTIKPLYIGE